MERRTVVLVATILGSSMAFVDSTVVNVALPTIGRELDLGLAGRQWVYLAYALPLASLYLLAGGVADRLGRRRVFLWGIACFAAASALAGAAPDAALLLGARAVQGAAGAFLAVASLSLLRATYGADSGRAVGLWTAWSGITTVVGPPLGGALTEWATWRLVFFLNLPLAAGAWLLTVRSTNPEPCNTLSLRELDLPGGALFTVAFGALTYGFVHPHSWWLFVVAVAALAAGIWRQMRAPQPMLPLSLFRNRAFSTAAVETFLVYAALGASTFFLVLYLQSVVGYSPLEASLPLVPISVVMLLLAGRFGAYADRHGPRMNLTVGPLLLACGIVLWLGVTAQSDWWLVALGSLVFALGLSILVAPITSAALSNAPERLSGIAAGVSNTTARVGGLVAVALVGLVISVAYEGAGAPLTASGEHGPSIHAFRAGMLVAVALSVAGAVAGAIGFTGTSRGSRSGSAARRSLPAADPERA